MYYCEDSDIEKIQMLRKMFTNVEEKIKKNEVQIVNNNLTFFFPFSYRYKPTIKIINNFMKKHNLNSFVYYDGLKETYVDGELLV